MTNPTDPTLRDRIADALLDHLSRTADIRTGRSGAVAFMPEVTDEERLRIADAVLAVLPVPSAPTGDRAAVLLEAADALGRMDYDTDSNDYGYDTYRDAWNGGVMDGADELRRLADEAQRQPTTETQPPRHRWSVETRDPLANEWLPGSHFGSRPHAVERYETVSRNAPLWRDGTPVQRRIVRETTTYTVEEPARRLPPMDPVHILGIDTDEPAPAVSSLTDAAEAADRLAVRLRADGWHDRAQGAQDVADLLHHAQRQERRTARETRLARHQTCGVCNAGYETGSECGTCALNARMAEERRP